MGEQRKPDTRLRASFNRHPTSNAFAFSSNAWPGANIRADAQQSLMNGDRRLVERSKGGQRPAASSTDKLGNLEQVPDPLWASVSRSANEETGLGPLYGSLGSGGSEVGMNEVLLFLRVKSSLKCLVHIHAQPGTGSLMSPCFPNGPVRHTGS